MTRSASERSLGFHPTPPAVVRYMVEATLGRWLDEGRGARAGARLRILDPACGDGAFLRGALEALAARGLAASARLHGVDVDERALAAAARAVPGARLARGDTLVDPPAALFPDVAGGFDLVLGNPPYVSGEHLPAAARAALAGFDLGRRGQPDLFKLFYERTLRELTAEGGLHAFLVPDALLARDEHADLRAWILEHAAVERLCHVGRVFPGVAVSTVAVIARKGAAGGRCRVDRWTGEAAVAAREVTLPAGGAPWSLAAPPRWPELRGRLEAAGLTLGDVLVPGPAGLTRGEEIGKSSLRPCPAAGPSPRHVAIYTGADVHRRRLGRPSRQVPAGAVAKPAAYYRGPRVLLVKTGAGPVAAADAGDLPVLQSVYVLHLSPAFRDRLAEDAVAALLTSALSCAYVYFRWTSGKQVQPQLTLANVRELPLPRLDADRQAALAAVARAARGPGPDERGLDEAIARIYGVDLAEWSDVLAPALDALPASQRPGWWRSPRKW